MKWILGAGSYYLWMALDDTEGWDCDTYTATFRKSLHMWVANGPCFFDGYASDGTPKFTGLLERHLLWWKYKRMTQNQMACRFAKAMTN